MAAERLTPADREEIARFFGSPDQARRALAALEEAERRADEWPLVLGEVTTNIVPGECGGGVEVPVTPQSMKAAIIELQNEWDGAEKRIDALRQRAEAAEAALLSERSAYASLDVAEAKIAALETQLAERTAQAEG